MFWELNAAVFIFLLLLIGWKSPKDGVSMEIPIPITILDGCQKRSYNFAASEFMK